MAEIVDQDIVASPISPNPLFYFQTQSVEKSTDDIQIDQDLDISAKWLRKSLSVFTIAPAVRIAITHDDNVEDIPIFAGAIFSRYIYMDIVNRIQKAMISLVSIDSKNLYIRTILTPAFKPYDDQ